MAEWAVKEYLRIMKPRLKNDTQNNSNQAPRTEFTPFDPWKEDSPKMMNQACGPEMHGNMKTSTPQLDIQESGIQSIDRQHLGYRPPTESWYPNNNWRMSIPPQHQYVPPPNHCASLQIH